MRGWFGRIAFNLNLPIIRRILNGSMRVRVIITDKDENHVLLVKNLLSRQKWSLPGGGVKAGESPEQAASRELMEELGIELDRNVFKELDRFNHLEAETKADWHAVVLTCAIDKTTPLNRRKSELLNHAWFSLKGLPADMSDLTAKLLEPLRSSSKS